MASLKGSYTPAKNQRDKKAQRFFRDEAIHVVCRVSEKSLQRSRWDFLRRRQILSFVFSHKLSLADYMSFHCL
jgi:hypothetical protein